MRVVEVKALLVNASVTTSGPMGMGAGKGVGAGQGLDVKILRMNP
jgi:hypothetical protein